MSAALPKKGTKYRIVQVELLVPDTAENWMDMLSDYRDANPAELVEWGMVQRTDSNGKSTSDMTREDAEAQWAHRHDETIDIIEEPK